MKEKTKLSNKIVTQFEERLKKTIDFYTSKDGLFIEQMNHDVALCEAGIAFFSGKSPESKNEEMQINNFGNNLENFSMAMGNGWFHYQDPEPGADFKLRNTVSEFLEERKKPSTSIQKAAIEVKSGGCCILS